MVEQEYANALFELAIEEKKIEIFNEDFDAVINTLSKELLDVISSPVINITEKKNIINKVYNQLDTTFVIFLNVLLDHGRFTIINDIYEEYNKLVLEQKNIVTLDVYSAKKLTKAELSNVEESMKKQYENKEIRINNIVDPNLIGGIKILSNGMSVDVSVKNTLNKMKEGL